MLSKSFLIDGNILFDTDSSRSSAVKLEALKEIGRLYHISFINLPSNRILGYEAC